MFSIMTVTAALRRVTGAMARRHATGVVARRRAVTVAIRGLPKKRQAAWGFAVLALSMFRDALSWWKDLTAVAAIGSSLPMSVVARRCGVNSLLNGLSYSISVAR
jgi:hypothetical protein